MIELENAIKLVRENVEWVEHCEDVTEGYTGTYDHAHYNYKGFIRSEPEIFVSLGIREPLFKRGESYNTNNPAHHFYCYLIFRDKEQRELKELKEFGKKEEMGKLYELLKDENFTKSILSNLELRKQMQLKAQIDSKEAKLRKLESLLI